MRRMRRDARTRRPGRVRAGRSVGPGDDAARHGSAVATARNLVSAMQHPNGYDRSSCGAMAAIALGVVMFAPGAAWQNDLSKLTPVPKDALARDAHLREALGAPDVRWLIAIRGAVPGAPGGDVIVRGNSNMWTLLHLRYTKHLIAGNTDGPGLRALPAWATVRDMAELTLADRRFVLCHYPLRAWNGQHRGAINLHGHSHGRLKPLPRQVDVGVDAWDFRPIGVADVLERAGRRKAAH